MAEEVLKVKRTGEFYYPIYFEEDFEKLAYAFKKEGLDGRSVCIVSDSNVAVLYKKQVEDVLRTISDDVFSIVFDAGEKNKHLGTIQMIYESLIGHDMDRKGILVALGGGVVGDMTGFAAATYLRGIDFVQIPTTLLAQADSSVGGKTGVDFQQYKNMIGAFHQPRFVYMNMKTLSTLPKEEFSCGMGEVIKTGLIYDGAFVNFLYDNCEQIHQLRFEMLSRMIRRCCEIKAGIVERDPREQGERALLNLGHTIGHAVEKLMNFELLHGQCVGLGMIAAAAISKNRGLLSEEQYQFVCKICRMYDLPSKVSGLNEEAILKVTKKDKKMEQGKIKFILMDGIGKCFIDKTVTDWEVLQGIQVIIS